MPSDADLIQQAEEWKKKGNEFFQKSEITDAIKSYSQGLVQVDRILVPGTTTGTSTTISNSSTNGSSSEFAMARTVKIALLSNRAACFLKTPKIQNCVDDCTVALDMFQQSKSAPTEEESKLRSKLLFRRAKGKYLLANLPPEILALSSTSSTGSSSSSSSSSSPSTTSLIPLDLLNEGAKDLLNVLSLEPNNKDASALLKNMRAQHAVEQKSNTPVSKLMNKIKQNERNNTERVQNLKNLLGLLDNDNATNGMELGRRGGVEFLLDLASLNTSTGSSTTFTSTGSQPLTAVSEEDGEEQAQAPPPPQEMDEDTKKQILNIRSLALQCLSCAGTHPPFVRAYCKDIQQQLLRFIQDDTSYNIDVSTLLYNLPISVLALYLRLLLHLDRDDPNQEIDGKTLVDNATVLEICKCAFQKYGDISIIKATLELLSIWTAGTQRDPLVRASLENSGSGTDGIHVPATKLEIDRMTAKELAEYRRVERNRTTRDEAWAYERSRLFCEKGGLDEMLKRAITTESHSVRRQMTVVVGRVIAALDNEDQIKKTVKPYLTEFTGTASSEVIIEEVYNDDGDVKEEEQELKEEEEEEDSSSSLSTIMKRAVITASLLLSRKEIGSWCILKCWDTSDDDLEFLIDSGNDNAMCLASEVISAASSVADCRIMMTQMMDSGAMGKLIANKDRDIRSGAASAMAKLGLSEASSDEGENMGLLQAAADLLEQEEEDYETNGSKQGSDDKQKNKKKDNKNKVDVTGSPLTSSFASTSIERGIEMITYLISRSHIKDEIAGGFVANLQSQETTLERLVAVSCLPGAGESLSGFGLATIFQHMAATSMQLRKEYFEDREFTMEQYDDLQRMAKTQEEKDAMDREKPDDSDDACADRIRRMANANVPRALVALTEGASEGTIEQIVRSMGRLASDESVRGLMIQQGVLTALIKIEKEENTNKLMKKAIRNARHCIAKLLVTTNPSVLTSAQRMGSIKPLIGMIRDVESEHIQVFEGCLAITNVASTGDDAQNRIIAERGIAALRYTMFSQNDMCRRAATEAMSNLVPHKKMMEHLKDPENLRLWLALSGDYEEHYECARAAAGCLAMATQDVEIALVLIKLKNFQLEMNTLLQCGQGELMHRVMVLLINLVSHGGDCLQACRQAGVITFCLAYVDSYHDGSKFEEMEITPEEMSLMNTTVELAKDVIKISESSG